MYVLETNVVSELRKATDGKADKHVTAWATSVLPTSLFVSAITILELELGVLRAERRDPTQGSSTARLAGQPCATSLRRSSAADRC